MSEEVARGTRGRRWPWAAGAVLAVLLVGGGWALASSFQSSAQQEANAKAPPATPVFSPVAEGTLARQASFTGSVAAAAQTQVTLQEVSGAVASVVTGHAVATGDTVTSGSVLTEVNGRPVLAVKSAFSFFRDIGFGDRGPDVTALQRVLAEMGYLGSVDGEYGAQTAQGVRDWYRDHGYDAPTRARPQVALADPTTPGASVEDPTGSSGKEAGSARVPAGEGVQADGGAPSNAKAAAPVAQDPYLSVSEIVAIADSPSRVIQGVTIGTHVGKSEVGDLVLGSTQLVITVSAQAAELGGVEKGDRAKVNIGGTQVDGVVGEIAQPGTIGRGQPNAEQTAPGVHVPTGQSQAGAGQGGLSGNQDAKVSFQITPTTPLSPETVTGVVRVVVTKPVVAERSLLVPALAILDRDGDHKAVAKRRNDGSLVEVPVTLLGSLQGQVAIAPTKAGTLSVGDEVRVG